MSRSSVQARATHLFEFQGRAAKVQHRTPGFRPPALVPGREDDIRLAALTLVEKTDPHMKELATSTAVMLL